MGRRENSAAVGVWGTATLKLAPHLYGFPSPDSDVDLRGCHVLPVRAVLGLHPPTPLEFAPRRIPRKVANF